MEPALEQITNLLSSKTARQYKHTDIQSLALPMTAMATAQKRRFSVTEQSSINPPIKNQKIAATEHQDVTISAQALDRNRWTHRFPREIRNMIYSHQLELGSHILNIANVEIFFAHWPEPVRNEVIFESFKSARLFVDESVASDPAWDGSLRIALRDRRRLVCPVHCVDIFTSPGECLSQWTKMVEVEILPGGKSIKATLLHDAQFIRATDVPKLERAVEARVQRDTSNLYSWRSLLHLITNGLRDRALDFKTETWLHRKILPLADGTEGLALSLLEESKPETDD